MVGRRGFIPTIWNGVCKLTQMLSTNAGFFGWSIGCGDATENTVGCSITGCLDSTLTAPLQVISDALSAVNRSLIEAHEEERSWIARELHDDINQQMALLAVNLESVRQHLPPSDVQTRRRIEQAAKRAGDIASNIQALSHRLHSSKLEYLGLVAASKGFCGEVSHQQNVNIAFNSQDVPKNLSQEISLCLFRVLQEAVQNAVKHSGVRQFEVSLKGAWNEIELSVHDSGVGFDPEKTFSVHGLGFTSMKERLKLVDGELSIDSNVQRGTTVQARVPLRPKMKSAGASG